MSTLNYPRPDEYKLPKKNILVISCMDLRLTDNLVDFLHFDNLHNRYDHFILAGTSLLTTEQRKHLFLGDNHKKYSPHWSQALMDHVELAINLHDIRDIYIVEHQDCGAYTNLLDLSKVDLSCLEGEINCHREFASELADRLIRDLAKYKDSKKLSINIHGFFIDLRGNVELMFSKPG